jgi:acyl-CoA synthetase (AMP-forming)/AMP-acid ligase II
MLCRQENSVVLTPAHFQNPLAPELSSLEHIIGHQAQHAPEALAILAPGRLPLTYGRLQRHIITVGKLLRGLGVGRHQRVALVLPDGPEMAVAFLAVAASATCVPLIPLIAPTNWRHILLISGYKC